MGIDVSCAVFYGAKVILPEGLSSFDVDDNIQLKNPKYPFFRSQLFGDNWSGILHWYIYHEHSYVNLYDGSPEFKEVELYKYYGGDFAMIKRVGLEYFKDQPQYPEGSSLTDFSWRAITSIF